jgi:hypothetical protein
VGPAAGVAANVAARGDSFFFDFATNGVASGDKTVLCLDNPELAAMSCFNALGASILLNVSRVGMDVVGWWSGLWSEG